jgi:hypothetical protein
LTAELIQLKVDVIVAWQTPAVQVAKQATHTIPIVMASADDPVGAGLVANLARPGGNSLTTSGGILTPSVHVPITNIEGLWGSPVDRVRYGFSYPLLARGVIVSRPGAPQQGP